MGNKQFASKYQSSNDPLRGSVGWSVAQKRWTKPVEQQSRGAQRECRLEWEGREARADSVCHFKCPWEHITETKGPVLEKGKPLSRDAIHSKEKVLFRNWFNYKNIPAFREIHQRKCEDFTAKNKICFSYPEESKLHLSFCLAPMSDPFLYPAIISSFIRPPPSNLMTFPYTS